MNEMKLTAYGHEVVITEEMADVLEALAEDDWATVRDMVAFADVVSSSISMNGTYSPSDEGLKHAMMISKDIKFFMSKMIGDQRYEQFQ